MRSGPVDAIVLLWYFLTLGLFDGWFCHFPLECDVVRESPENVLGPILLLVCAYRYGILSGLVGS